MRKTLKVLSVGTVLLCACLLIAPGASAGDKEKLLGLEPGPGTGTPGTHFAADPERLDSLLRATGFMLCPIDMAIGAFDPFDGTYLGDFITDTELSWPLEVVQGPDSNIYVCDGAANKEIRVYDISGQYLYTYLDASDGVGLIYGFDFRDGHLFVCDLNDFANFIVWEFDGPHSKVGEFIQTTSTSCYDIHFLDDNSCLIVSLLGDTIDHYDATGNFIGNIFSGVSATQVCDDMTTPGDYLMAASSGAGGHIRDFDLDGTIYDDLFPANVDWGWGIERLDNGNYLFSDMANVFEVEAGTGNILDTEWSGYQGRFIARVDLTQDPGVDVKVNGGDSGVVIPSADNVTITVDVVAAGAAGYPVELWVLGVNKTNGNKYTYGVYGSGLWLPGMNNVYYSGGLIDISETVLNKVLPVGKFDVYLAVDLVLDGQISMPYIYTFDMVDFEVVP